METLDIPRKAPNSGRSLPIRTAKGTERIYSHPISHKYCTTVETKRLDDVLFRNLQNGQCFDTTIFDSGSQTLDHNRDGFHVSNSVAQHHIPLSQYSLTIPRFGSPTQAVSTMDDSILRSITPAICASLTSATQTESGSLYTSYQWDSILPDDLNPSHFSYAYGQTDVLSDWQSPAAPWMEISRSAASNHQDLPGNTFGLNQDVSPITKSPRLERDDTHAAIRRLATDSATHSGQVLNEMRSYSFSEFDWKETNQVVLSGQSSPLTPSSGDVNTPISTSEDTRHKRRATENGGRQKRHKSSKDKAVYICNIEECGQQFSSGKDLHRHQHSTLIHEEECELKFPCNEPRCRRYGSSYTRKDNYDRHVKTMHKDFNN